MIGLGAIGLTLVYSILRFPNFAHGELIAWGAFTVGAVIMDDPESPTLLELDLADRSLVDAPADWRTVGFEDGTAGRSEGGIGRYRQQCSEHGVTPDLESYRAGHAEGLPAE